MTPDPLATAARELLAEMERTAAHAPHTQQLMDRVAEALAQHAPSRCGARHNGTIEGEPWAFVCERPAGHVGDCADSDFGDRYGKHATSREVHPPLHCEECGTLALDWIHGMVMCQPCRAKTAAACEYSDHSHANETAPAPQPEADTALGRALREAREAWGGAYCEPRWDQEREGALPWEVYVPDDDPDGHGSKCVAIGATELEALHAAIAAAPAGRRG